VAAPFPPVSLPTPVAETAASAQALSSAAPACATPGEVTDASGEPYRAVDPLIVPFQPSLPVLQGGASCAATAINQPFSNGYHSLSGDFQPPFIIRLFTSWTNRMLLVLVIGCSMIGAILGWQLMKPTAAKAPAEVVISSPPIKSASQAAAQVEATVPANERQGTNVLPRHQQKRVDKYIGLARRLVRKQNYRKAHFWATKALRLQPMNRRAVQLKEVAERYMN
jgi:hypothetical protein